MVFAVQLCFTEGGEQDVTVQAQELPPTIPQLLLEYEDIFLGPTELSHVRECDPRIPLMLGAQPVNIPPYI